MQPPESPPYSSTSNWLLLPAQNHYRHQNHLLRVSESPDTSSFSSPKVIHHDRSYQQGSTFSYHQNLTDETPLLFNTYHQAHEFSYLYNKDNDSMRTDSYSPITRRRQLQLPIIHVPIKYSSVNQLHSPTDSDTTETPSRLSLRNKSYSKMKEKLPAKHVKFNKQPEHIRLKTLKENEKEHSVGSSAPSENYMNQNQVASRVPDSKTYQPSPLCLNNIKWRRLRKVKLKKQVSSSCSLIYT